ncbi:MULTISPECIES: enoyl-CoA hydratase/isomerase family protein [Bradyrhizobium]|uniref:Enoyl-CoA hydratase/isomerase family protein n=3 Tax=Bradyrhizobium TaxID=374 RepID=A0AAE6CCB5_9BRAD|nr:MULTISPECIES: enoyl-CoA hydratase/isomerase family protein [Bradyrhizobium]MCG2632948.1 enoyl-CoA hydratase/isomerase family protein [Bradyrhizobium zhengyangense]MCG2645678.1 enoyl-CoA hydratase/isomerase family protein [Bradyrhizobium zhengyangense]MCG2673150.1 enoyl-CoA hydratase/isomerase family protein [Bradyrhizobium zhengyangense]MDN4988245.1 enoyl-CoA hydratase/isomerase family protein [Bradyrhizobium sp. WYCCWR 13022]MDN5006301.1 enoyl-CoA hydratase/isomerase family protein [Bradyr
MNKFGSEVAAGKQRNEEASELGNLPTLHVSKGIARIQLNRSRQHNRFEPTDIETFSEIVATLARQSSVRVLMITAQGPSFSSGFDLDTLSSDRAAACTALFAAMCDLVEECPFPTICGLNGNIYGGATDLALACDFRIGTRGCLLQMSPSRLGIQYYYSGLRRYVERLGLSQTKRLFLTGEQVDSITLLQMGYLTEVCTSDALEARLEHFAGMLAQRSPASLRGLKTSLNSIRRGTADPVEINAKFFESLTSPDAREGLKAWCERRPPSFADV